MPDEPRHPEFFDPEDAVAFGAFLTETCPDCNKEVTAKVLRRTLTFAPGSPVHGLVFPDVLTAVCTECGKSIRVVQTAMVGMGEKKAPREPGREGDSPGE